MNRMRSLVCIGVFLVSTAPHARAQNGAAAVEHSIPFETLSGQLLMLGDYMVFFDQEQPAESYVVPRKDIEDVNINGDAITIHTSEPIRNRSGEVRRLSFRALSGSNPNVVSSWYAAGGGSAADIGSAARPQASAPEGGATYEVRHNHFVGDCRGRLIVGPDMLSFESVSDVSHSRRWQYHNIKETNLSNPYELRINLFSGETYNFRFDGGGMDPIAYTQLVDRVTAARTPNP